MKLLGCTGRFNATLGPCGATRVAQAFDPELCEVAELAVVAAGALAWAAVEPGCVQSRAIWPD